MRAVSYRWSNLSKEQKTPFEQIAVEDKLRYDKDVTDFKKGAFMGRSLTPQIRIQQGDNENVSTALEISDDLLQFLQVKNLSLPAQKEEEEQMEEEVAEEEEEVEEEEVKRRGGDSMLPENSNNLKVVIENVDEA